ncbi:30S ribosomal protein S2 [Candidatus Microgenomates bacterium]|nr:30S ribosomal protein S2 [Candidatus Microgenomates bacterium]
MSTKKTKVVKKIVKKSTPKKVVSKSVSKKTEKKVVVKKAVKAPKPPKKTSEVSLEALLESGAHFGHQVRRWNPKVRDYVYGAQDGVHIFDLVKTKAALEEALNEIKKAKASGKSILLLGTKKQIKEKVAEVAISSGVSYVNERWLGGTITNFDQIKKSIAKLDDLKTNMASGGFAKYTKKERVLIEREIARLERFFGGISTLKEKPDMIIVVDIRREATAIREAKRKGVATVGIVDTNADPDDVDFPIPMNDDATKALVYVLDLIGEVLK